MEYRWKKQRTTLGTYVMYDLGRNPQKNYGKHQDGVISFKATLDRAVFFSKLDVEGFGGAILFADNEGKGYEPAEEARDFWYEAAKSRKYRVKAHMQKFEKEWGFVPAQVKERLEKAETLLAQTDGGTDGPKTYGNEDCPDHGENTENALCQILWAGEELVLLEAELKIARRGPRKDFCFIGCMKGFTDGGEAFRNNFKRLFGEAVIPTHWGCVEPREGEKHYDVIFDMLDWCTENHIPVRGHALVWFSDWWEGKNWMGEYGRKDYEAFKRLVAERAEYILSNRPNAFDSVDFNEPLQSNPFNFTFEQHFEICKEVYGLIRKYSPKTKLMINFYDEWQANYGFDENSIPEVREWKQSYGLPDSVPNRYCVSVPYFLDKCREAGIKVDILGLQFHDYPYDLFNTMELINWWYDRYHLPIQLTEVSTPSQTGKTPFHMGKRPVPITKYWHRPWDERLQEQWYREFSTYFYSTDCVQGITAWSISDAPTQWADYLEGHPNEKFKLQAFDYDGLFDWKNEPKPSYYGLCELAKKWGLKTGERER